jgi:arsenite-transporting ATPase
MRALAALMQIAHLHDGCDYEVIIVDCGPTGATLRFLSIPEAANWYIERILPIERTGHTAEPSPSEVPHRSYHPQR